jgi:hypothetical protein
MIKTTCDLKISYYTYSFENNKSIYKFDRWSPKPEYQNNKEADEEDAWYFDLLQQNEHAKTNCRN